MSIGAMAYWLLVSLIVGVVLLAATAAGIHQLGWTVKPALVYPAMAVTFLLETGLVAWSLRRCFR